MKAMGIARQSLDDTLGDKRALYLKAPSIGTRPTARCSGANATTRIDCQNSRVPFISLLANIPSL